MRRGSLGGHRSPMPQSFDEAFPGGFEECVRELGQEDSVDDPEALCGWLQENGFEAIQSENPDDILASLEVEYVSVVDTPAQDSEWLVAKSAEADADEFDPTEDPLRDGEFVVNKQSEEPERKVWAAVLIPGEVDKQGDLVPEPEIERAAHNYLKHYRKVDEDHDLVDGSGEPIESYVLKQETTFDLPDGSGERTYPKGTWIMGVQLTDDAWKRVESGELTGFSIYGGAASLEPGELLTPEQKEVLLNMDGERTEKEIEPSDLAEAVDEFQATTGEDATDATLVEFVEWAEEFYGSDDSEDGESEETEEDGEDEDGQESSKESETAGDGGDSDGGSGSEQETKDMGDDPDDGQDEQNAKLDELLEKTETVQESVEETRKSVESVEERVDDLEKEVFDGGDDDDPDSDPEGEAEGGDGLDEETREEVEEVAASAAETAAQSGVEKALREAFGAEDADEGDDLGEVIRKGERFPDPDHDEGEEDRIETNWGSVVAEEEV